jgi:hypothetical protein
LFLFIFHPKSSWKQTPLLATCVRFSASASAVCRLARFAASSLAPSASCARGRWQRRPGTQGVAVLRGARTAGDGKRVGADLGQDRSAAPSGGADAPHCHRVAPALPHRRRGRAGQDHRDRAHPAGAGQPGRTDPGADGGACGSGEQLAPRAERGVQPRLRGVRLRGRHHRPQDQRLRQARPTDRQHRHPEAPGAYQAPAGCAALGSGGVRRSASPDGLPHRRQGQEDRELQAGRGAEGPFARPDAAVGHAAPGQSLPVLDAGAAAEPDAVRQPRGNAGAPAPPEHGDVPAHQRRMPASRMARRCLRGAGCIPNPS